MRVVRARMQWVWRKNVRFVDELRESMVRLSPAHLKNLLCERCTHASIGASLEPVLDRIPRLFVTWELLEFPQGPPREIDDYNR